jgi:Thioesterase domain
VEDLPRLAALYASAMCELVPEGPYLLGGVGLGGVIAYEAALQLQQAGHRVRTQGSEGRRHRARPGRQPLLPLSRFESYQRLPNRDQPPVLHAE